MPQGDSHSLGSLPPGSVLPLASIRCASLVFVLKKLVKMLLSWQRFGNLVLSSLSKLQTQRAFENIFYVEN